MAQKIITHSDISGDPIPEGVDASRMIIIFSDARRGIFFLDITDEEAEEFAVKGMKLRRGTKIDVTAQLTGVESGTAPSSIRQAQ